MRARTPLVAVVAALCFIVATVITVVTTGTRAAASDHADPVIIVAGTFSPEVANEPLRARMALSGYDASIFELPYGGVGPIAGSSAALAAYVDDVMARTGSSQVDLVGHSQGGLVARHYVKYLGGADHVDSLITLGTPNHGTALVNISEALGITGDCPGCEQMAIGSEFLADLNAGDDTIGSVAYTNIYTSFDEIVFPASTARLDDGAANIRVQSQCLFRVVGHLGLIYDGTVYDGVHDALQHRRVRLNCFAL